MGIIRESHIRYGEAHATYFTWKAWLILIALILIVLCSIYGPELWNQLQESICNSPHSGCERL